MALLLVGLLFWRHRKNVEQARHLIQRHCQRLDLQLLELNFSYEGPRKLAGHWRWVRCYQFAFSSTGESRYQAKLLMLGPQYKFELPPYRVDEAPDDQW